MDIIDIQKCNNCNDEIDIYGTLSCCNSIFCFKCINLLQNINYMCYGCNIKLYNSFNMEILLNNISEPFYKFVSNNFNPNNYKLDNFIKNLTKPDFLSKLLNQVKNNDFIKEFKNTNSIKDYETNKEEYEKLFKFLLDALCID
jgi:hypothetical protein